MMCAAFEVMCELEHKFDLAYEVWSWSSSLGSCAVSSISVVSSTFLCSRFSLRSGLRLNSS